MEASYAEKNWIFWEEDSTKGAFVEAVLILADFYCLVNDRKSNEYKQVCDQIAIDLCNIFHVSIQPCSTFQEFRRKYKVADSHFKSKFESELGKLLASSGIPILQLMDKHPRFEEICDEIDSRRVAILMAEALFPNISPRK
ncbi:hypothetical protein [Paraflavitalea pollutisoli]|uniref:hypothetical protein n=1 Tax=Paraflavitalea pollutisoli TaxID=3034143 RepID=UPI0023EDBE4E|nr:hypothetical protein [Paraflavitalea sp. H1-2-19X]